MENMNNHGNISSWTRTPLSTPHCNREKLEKNTNYNKTIYGWVHVHKILNSYIYIYTYIMHKILICNEKLNNT